MEGDVNPTRDLDIISEELRLKDIEFVEKALENQKKKTRQGGQSLEQKKAREEEALIEKILAWLKGGKDLRKGNWSPKEVGCTLFLTQTTPKPLYDDKGLHARSNPSSSNARTDQRSAHHEITSFLILSYFNLHLCRYCLAQG